MTTWHNGTSASEQWGDAPTNDDRLASLLEVAKDKVIAYARPADLVGISTDPDVEDEIPPRLREAQLRVAINLWNDEEADTTAVDPPDFPPTTRRYLEWKKIVRRSGGCPPVSGETVRDYLTRTLKPLLPADWRFIPNQRMPETISVVTAVVKHTRIEPLAAAPIGNANNTVVLTVASPPNQDNVKAEIALDDAVIAVVTAVDGLDTVGWTLAEKVEVNKGKYLGWDITLTVITSKE